MLWKKDLSKNLSCSEKIHLAFSRVVRVWKGDFRKKLGRKFFQKQLRFKKVSISSRILLWTDYLSFENSFYIKIIVLFCRVYFRCLISFLNRSKKLDFFITLKPLKKISLIIDSELSFNVFEDNPQSLFPKREVLSKFLLSFECQNWAGNNFDKKMHDFFWQMRI